MRILFVVRGKEFGVSPIVLNQAESLIKYCGSCKIEYFIINEKGIIGYIKNLALLKRAVKINKPDIIHAHYSYCGYLAGLTFKKKKIVVSLMGSDSRRGGIGLFLVNLFSYIFWGKTIVKSESMKSHFKNKGMIVLPNGVNFERFKPLAKKECQIKTGFIPEKRHIVFFLSDPGRTEKNLPLAQKAISLIDNSKIEFHVINYVDKEKVPIILNASDLLLLTSFYEGSPNIIKEAMACNVPIVSTDVGDVRATISNTEGCYISSFDPIEVKDNIEKAIKYGKRTNGRDNIKFLNSQEISKRLLEIYYGLSTF